MGLNTLRSTKQTSAINQPTKTHAVEVLVLILPVTTLSGMSNFLAKIIQRHKGYTRLDRIPLLFYETVSESVVNLLVEPYTRSNSNVRTNVAAAKLKE